MIEYINDERLLDHSILIIDPNLKKKIIMIKILLIKSLHFYSNALKNIKNICFIPNLKH